MTYGSYMGSWQPSAAGPYTGRRTRNSSGAFGLCICTDLDAFYPKTEGLTYGLTDSETDRQPQVGFRSSGPPSVTHIRKAESVLFYMVLSWFNFSSPKFRGEVTKVTARCSDNVDASGLPNTSFESLCPKLENVGTFKIKGPSPLQSLKVPRIVKLPYLKSELLKMS